MVITTAVEYDDGDFTRDRALCFARQALRQFQDHGKTFVTFVSANPRFQNVVVEIDGNRLIVRLGVKKG